MKRSRVYVGLALLAGLSLGAAALAQQNPSNVIQQPPTVAGLASSVDLVQVSRQGAGGPAVYAATGQIASAPKVSYQVPLTGFTITVPTGTGFLLLNPAGTLATGTITLDPTPADGQHFCWQSTQTQTAVTISANTGQTLAGATTETSGTANTPHCRTFVQQTNTWYASVAGSP